MSLLYSIGQWVLTNGYTVMFIGMLIEGPAVTAAGSFAASLGYFNIQMVFILSILGNIVPDIIFYALGFWGRNKILNRWGHHVGLSEKRLEHLERLLATHPGKTMFAIKMVPTLAAPGLIAAGVARMSLKVYIWWSAIITIPSSLFYLLIGYYFGATYNSIIQYVGYGSYVLGGILILFFLVIYANRKIMKKIAERVEKI
ncbi:MAG: DedA family protein [Minisyncoccia bacterium]